MTLLTSLLTGLLFGAGLLVSGMADPAKVLSFLDLSGDWDPSLAFVMIGAVAVGVAGFGVARHRKTTLFGAEMCLPTARHIDRRLLLGSMLFGIGWGIAGFCPGPALVALGAGEIPAAIFVFAMVVGMGAFEVFERCRVYRLTEEN